MPRLRARKPVQQTQYRGGGQVNESPLQVDDPTDHSGNTWGKVWKGRAGIYYVEEIPVVEDEEGEKR